MTGRDVRMARRALGMTQVEFAAKVGVHPISVSRWERDEVRVTPPVARLISLLLTTPTRTRKGRR